MSEKPAASPLSVNTSYDIRVQWLQQRTQTALKDFLQNTFKTKQQNLFSECLERNARQNYNALLDFLSDKNHESSVLFYADTVTVRTEKEVDLPETPALATSTSQNTLNQQNTTTSGINIAYL